MQCIHVVLSTLTGLTYKKTITMTELEVLNGKKLICAFLEWELCTDFNTVRVPYVYPFYDINGDQTTEWIEKEFHSLPFDTSWDLLMPVVDKIHFLRMKDVYRRSNVSVKGDKIFTLYISAQIESVWLAVVNFIEWYNANVATIG